MGCSSGHTSGDPRLAFSNASRNRADRSSQEMPRVLGHVAGALIDPLFRATLEATEEEAVLNALVAAETLAGRDGNTAHAIPQDRLLEILGRCGRR